MKNKIEPFEQAPEHIKKIIKQVLQLEKERLEQTRPRVNADIVNIIKSEVRE